MRTSAALPMAPWRSRPPPAASLRWPPIGSPTGRNAKGQSWKTISVAGLIHRCEFAAAEIHHARGQPAAARDPAPHVLRVDVHQQLRRLAARHLLAIAAGMPCRVEAEPRARRDADAVGRDHAEQHGARRQAGAVDDDPLARAAQRHQVFKVRADLAPGSALILTVACAVDTASAAATAPARTAIFMLTLSVLPAPARQRWRRPRPNLENQMWAKCEKSR